MNDVNHILNSIKQHWGTAHNFMLRDIFFCLSHQLRELKRNEMNKIQVKGNWTEHKGKIKQRFANLTGNKLMFEEGKKDELLGKFLFKLGKTKEELRKFVRHS